MAALLAWRSVFEIVNLNQAPAGARRRDKGAVINGDLRSTEPGVRRRENARRVAAARWAEGP
jgi:hypothetical protein